VREAFWFQIHIEGDGMIKVITFLCTILLPVSAQAFSPDYLWQAWPEARFRTTVAPCLRHTELSQQLKSLESAHAEHIRLQEIGKSFLRRPIQMLSLGRGEKKILLWSQMHGDEPSATPALLDIANYLLENPGREDVRSILDNFTLLMIPMLNPDGAEVYQRFNAQGIDINRDALHLATPEGRILKQVRDQYQPMLGFNLHDQNRRTAVGDSGQVASNAVLAVSGDAANTLTLGRVRTKKASSAIVEALAGLMPGGMARYDEDWSPRAFGDNITAWGTPVVLIESGGLPPGQEFSQLTRLNFVAILTVLGGLARDDLATYDPQVYEDLLRNKSRVYSDIIVRDGHIMQPGTGALYRADLAFDVLRSDRQAAGCPDSDRLPSAISLLGDASFQGAGTSIDASDSLLIAAFDVGVKGWSETHWLNADSLSKLGALGVGTVYWSVNATHKVLAIEQANQMMVAGLPRVVVVSGSDPLPAVILSGPPEQADSNSLPAILSALGLEVSADVAALQKMWIKATGNKAATARLRPRAPASFLIIKPLKMGEIDFNASELEAVWLDGQLIKPVSGSGE
jgi:hypothetical protein